MNFAEYLDQRAGGRNIKTLTRNEATLLGLKYPLQSGWHKGARKRELSDGLVAALTAARDARLLQTAMRDAKKCGRQSPEGAFKASKVSLRRGGRSEDAAIAASHFVAPIPGNLSTDVIWLDVPNHERQIAMNLGARWNRFHSMWYVPPGLLMSSFERWLPTTMQAEKLLRRTSQPAA